MSDVRPAAQWPDSGARALDLRRLYPTLDPVTGHWYWGPRADGHSVDVDGVLGIEDGPGVQAVRVTAPKGSDRLTFY